jgi:alpha-L-rhamnosidase
MADLTGTLWEHMSHNASCNHGFASYIAHILYRDVLGIRDIDYINKIITVRFTDLVLDGCSGTIPIGEDSVNMSWKRSGNQINYSFKAPEGYQVKFEKLTSAQLNQLSE